MILWYDKVTAYDIVILNGGIKMKILPTMLLSAMLALTSSALPVYAEEEITAPAEQIANSYKKYDANGDSKVSIVDLVCLNLYVSGTGTIKSSAAAAADINEDGRINIFDVILMRQKIAETPNDEPLYTIK